MHALAGLVLPCPVSACCCCACSSHCCCCTHCFVSCDACWLTACLHRLDWPPACVQVRSSLGQAGELATETAALLSMEQVQDDDQFTPEVCCGAGLGVGGGGAVGSERQRQVDERGFAVCCKLSRSLWCAPSPSGINPRAATLPRLPLPPAPVRPPTPCRCWPACRPPPGASTPPRWPCAATCAPPASSPSTLPPPGTWTMRCRVGG